MSDPRHSRWSNHALQAGYYLLTGLILVLPALMNGSPIVYSDSGTYMRCAFDITPAVDRPVGYSLIIRAVTWRSSMWPLIFFQGAVTSWLLFEVLRQLFPGKSRLWRLHVTVIGALTLFSSLPWYASQVMPDVIAGLLALVVFLVFFGRRLNRLKLAFLWTLLFFFTISHYSYMAMMIGLLVVLACARATRWGGGAMGVTFWKNWAGLAAMTLAAFLYVMNLNARYGNGAVISPTSDLFLASKLAESGVLYEHLKRTCPENHNWLCDRMDELNTTAMHFVWDGDAPLRDHREMIEASERVAPILHEVLVDPRNWGMLLWTSMNATLLQLAQVDVVAGVDHYREGSAPWYTYAKQLRHELPSFMDSDQNRGGWDLTLVNAVGYPVLLLSLFVIMLRWPSHTARTQAFVLLCMVVVVLNAAATGALANVYARLQARLTWLIVLCAVLLLVQRHHRRVQRWLAA